MMRWLKKIKLNKSFVILAFLMNYNLIVNTTPSTLVPTLVSTTTNTSSSATNITLCADRARSCNNSSTQVNRERSAKISSERIKGEQLHIQIQYIMFLHYDFTLERSSGDEKKN